jgi:hypothetical protein
MKFRFRFWSKLLNHFVIPNDDIFVGALEDDNMTVTQYTTKNDTNGKEIFEGDLVKYKGDTAEVIWQDCGWRLKKVEIIPMSLQIPLGVVSGKDLVVVGNIYQSEMIGSWESQDVL